MTTYGLVDNGSVLKYSSKPTSARTSNLWLNPEAMEAEGWLPVVDNKPSTEYWERLGERTETVDVDHIDWTYSIDTVSLDAFKEYWRKRLVKNARGVLEDKHDAFELSLASLGVLPSTLENTITSNAQSVADEVVSKRQSISAAVAHSEVAAIYPGIVAFLPASDVDGSGWPIPREP